MWSSKADRERLLLKISLLAMTGGVRQGLRRHTPTSISGQQHVLTIAQEGEIANNLVFFGRRNSNSQNVTAVGIEEDENGKGMVVRLAVNGVGMKTAYIQEGLQKMCQMLQEIHVNGRFWPDSGILRGLTLSDHDEAQDFQMFFKAVVRLCATRIVSRIKPKSAQMVARVKSLRAKISSRTKTQEEQTVREKLLRFLDLVLLSVVKNKTPEDLLPVCEQIIEAASGLVVEETLNTFLASSASKDEDLGCRMNDLIIKLAQYRRASHQLVSAARRRQCHLFQDIRVDSYQIEVPEDVRSDTALQSASSVLTAFSQTSAAIKLSSRYKGSFNKASSALTRRLNRTRAEIKVHAEIKLLFWYELHPEVRRPRVIAANKSCCYLCDLFFRVHGIFQVPSTYGMLQERWILPDWLSVPDTQLKHLRATLVAFEEALNEQIACNSRVHARNPDPMQSLVALSVSWSDASVARPDLLVNLGDEAPRLGHVPMTEYVSLAPGEAFTSSAVGPIVDFDIHMSRHFAQVIFYQEAASQGKQMQIRVSLTPSLTHYQEDQNHESFQILEDIGIGEEKEAEITSQGLYICALQQIAHVEFELLKDSPVRALL